MGMPERMQMDFRQPRLSAYPLQTVVQIRAYQIVAHRVCEYCIRLFPHDPGGEPLHCLPAPMLFQQANDIGRQDYAPLTAGRFRHVPVKFPAACVYQGVADIQQTRLQINIFPVQGA